jgi:3-oxoacyl-[acyl-carrier protein] reductase
MQTHTAIVTGGSRGIGLSIARAIVLDGGRVMIAGRDQGSVERAVGSLAAHAPDRIAGLAVDVRKRPEVDALVAAAMKRFGSVDTLINNAGIGVFGDVSAMSDEDWHRVIDTNLTGAFYCTSATIPCLRQAGGGWIINIASLAGRNYFAKGAAYCASKAGLVAFSEALMQEVRFENIRVSCVMPGSVATEFDGATPTDADAWKLSPDDIAQVVMDLLRHPSRSLPSKVEIRPAKTK